MAGRFWCKRNANDLGKQRLKLSVRKKLLKILYKSKFVRVQTGEFISKDLGGNERNSRSYSSEQNGEMKLNRGTMIREMKNSLNMDGKKLETSTS